LREHWQLALFLDEADAAPWNGVCVSVRAVCVLCVSAYVGAGAGAAPRAVRSRSAWSLVPLIAPNSFVPLPAPCCHPCLQSVVRRGSELRTKPVAHRTLQLMKAASKVRSVSWPSAELARTLTWLSATVIVHRVRQSEQDQVKPVISRGNINVRGYSVAGVGGDTATESFACACSGWVRRCRGVCGCSVSSPSWPRPIGTANCCFALHMTSACCGVSKTYIRVQANCGLSSQRSFSRWAVLPCHTLCPIPCGSLLWDRFPACGRPPGVQASPSRPTRVLCRSGIAQVLHVRSTGPHERAPPHLHSRACFSLGGASLDIGA
jgi:hypothetical protein